VLGGAGSRRLVVAAAELAYSARRLRVVGAGFAPWLGSVGLRSVVVSEAAVPARCRRRIAGRRHTALCTSDTSIKGNSWCFGGGVEQNEVVIRAGQARVK